MISVPNKLLWILYLTNQRLWDCISSFDLARTSVNLHLDFMFWYDGGKMFGRRKGLFSAIKVVNAYLSFDNNIVPVPVEVLRLLQSISWVLTVQRGGENKVNVGELEKNLLSQWIEIKEDHPERQLVHSNDRGSIRLVPRLLGFVSDHGIRLKSLPTNSQQSRCGECTFMFCRAMGFAFLDWNLLCEIKRCSVTNWAQTHFDDISEHLELWKTLDTDSFMTYDNHHNIVGHFQTIFEVIRSVLPEHHAESFANSLYNLTRISAKTQPRGAKLPDHKFYRGFHWRMVSLNIDHLLEPFWYNTTVANSFDALFKMFTEIHLFNYVHWDRMDELFLAIRARYAVVLFQFTEQLRHCIPASEIHKLCTIYLHKILIHSLLLFRDYNLAACSCEQGESLISILNSVLPYTSGDYEARLRKLLLSLTLTEERRMEQGLHRDKSVVFQNFFSDYKPPTLELKLSIKEYEVLKKIFSFCDLPTPDSVLPVRYQRSDKKYWARCPGMDMEHMIRVSTPRDTMDCSSAEPWVLRVRKDLLPGDTKEWFTKPAPKQPKASRSKLEHLKSLQDDICSQIELLSRGVRTCATVVLSNIEKLQETELSTTWKATDESSLAAELGFYLDPKRSWQASFSVGEKAKEFTKSKKASLSSHFTSTLMI